MKETKSEFLKVIFEKIST